MAAKVRDGWLFVDYDGPELTTIEIGVGERQPISYQPAFLDWLDGRRVAKIRPHIQAKFTRVWLRVNGVTTKAGNALV